MNSRFDLLFKENKRSLTAGFFVTIALIVVFLSTYLAFKNFERFMDSYLGLNGATVYFDYEVEDYKVNDIIRNLKKERIIENIELKKGSFILDDLKDSFPEISPSIGKLKIENLPDYADIRFKVVSNESINELVNRLTLNPHVSMIIAHKDHSKEVKFFINGFDYAIYSLLLAMLLTILLSSYVIIQQNLFSGFDEIKILKMLGAKVHFIIKPFILQIMFLFASALFVAFILTFLFVNLVYSLINQFATQALWTETAYFFNWEELAVISLSTMLFAFLGSYISSLRTVFSIQRIL